MDEFDSLQAEGKRLAAVGHLAESLKCFEKARKIKETPKILSRIEKLKTFLQKLQGNESTIPSSASSLEEPDLNRTKLIKPFEGKEIHKKAGVLHQIQNVDISQRTIPSNPKDLSVDELKRFNQLKKSATALSYEGKLTNAMEMFQEALKICECPNVKKYIQDLKVISSKKSKKLEEVQKLTLTGQKLASEGKKIESLETLKHAFAVCPSPKISKLIKQVEAQQTNLKECPSKLDYSSTTSKSTTVDEAINIKKENIHLSNTESVSKLTCSSSSSVNTTFSKKSENSPSDLQSLDPEDKKHYRELYEQARDYAAEGELQSALNCLLKAKQICACDKIIKRIKDIELHIEASKEEDNDDDDGMIEVAKGFSIYHEIYKKLYPYQREGVAWMWGLHKSDKGGVLGDDMGLGKTFQVIAFLSGLIDADLIKHVLIAMPVSLLPNWENEFKKWCPGISVGTFHGGSKREREKTIQKIQRRGHVLLTSYGMIVNSLNLLSEYDYKTFVWDYVILDEGHKIKNPTKTTKAVHDIPSRNRIVLTGTPIQNNLKELWSLYDFAHKGTLLGSMKTFKMQYENVIVKAREKDATVGEKRLGTKMAENLRNLIQPYFLRRTKLEIWGKPGTSTDVAELENKLKNLGIESKSKLTARKNDLIVWVNLTEAQIEIYKNVSCSEEVQRILMTKKSPLMQLTILKKICDHPRLFSQRACHQLGLNEESDEINNDESTSIEYVSDETLQSESAKMFFLIKLLDNLKENGHRTLVFSLSKKILDMVQRILLNKNWKVLRIDGSISKIAERERRIQLFQKDPSYPVFLLTTQVGGVGITLTAADRVVIYDPSWNPATDAQAVDRVYRIGQKKNVVVYRLITCGSVEEKIYRRQVFKESITKQATGTSDPYRYFSNLELRELFTLDNPKYSATQVQLSSLHSNERRTDCSLDEHIAYLHSLNIFGISDHDLMFSKSVVNPEEDLDERDISQGYIDKQVQLAQESIQTEAAVVEEGIRIAGTHVRPFAERVPVFKAPVRANTYNPPSFPTSDFASELKKFQVPRPSSDTALGILAKPSSIEHNERRYSQRYQSLLVSNADTVCDQEDPKDDSIIEIHDETVNDSKTEELGNQNVDVMQVEIESDITGKSFVAHDDHLIEIVQTQKEVLSENVDIITIDDDQEEEANTSMNVPILSHRISYSKGDSVEKLVPNENAYSCSILDEYLTEIKDSVLPKCDALSQLDTLRKVSNSTNISLNNSELVDNVFEMSDLPEVVISDPFAELLKSDAINNQESSSDGSASSPPESLPKEENGNVSSNGSFKEASPTPVVETEDLEASFKDASESIVQNKTQDVSVHSQNFSNDVSIKEGNFSDSASEEEWETSFSNAENKNSPKQEPYNPNQEHSIFQPNEASSFISEVSASPYYKKRPFCIQTNMVQTLEIADLSFEDEKPKRKVRKSCAKPQSIFIDSDSDDIPSATTSANNTESVLCNDSFTSSEDEASSGKETSSGDEKDDSMVPSSIPNTPLQSSDVRRITPLRLRNSLPFRQDPAFATALKSSPVLPCLNQSLSPVISTKKKWRKIVVPSDSDED